MKTLNTLLSMKCFRDKCFSFRARMVKKPDLQGELGLRSLTVVIVKNATEDAATANRTRTYGCGRGDRSLPVDSLMWTRGVVVSDQLPHDSSQMSLFDDEQIVQKLLPDGSHPALRMGMGIRGMIGRMNHPDPFRAKNGIKRLHQLLAQDENFQILLSF